MATYTTPVTAAFEWQRQSIEQGQRALARSVEFQRAVNRALVDGLDGQRAAQRRAVELSQRTTHDVLDAVDASVPGAAGAIEPLREAVDEQYDLLLESHDETVAAVARELEQGVDAYDDLSDDYLDVLEDQIDMLVEAHEELESQSVDAVERLVDQVEELQERTDDVSQQVREVQRQAAEAVEA